MHKIAPDELAQIDRTTAGSDSSSTTTGLIDAVQIHEASTNSSGQDRVDSSAGTASNVSHWAAILEVVAGLKKDGIGRQVNEKSKIASTPAIASHGEHQTSRDGSEPGQTASAPPQSSSYTTPAYFPTSDWGGLSHPMLPGMTPSTAFPGEAEISPPPPPVRKTTHPAAGKSANANLPSSTSQVPRRAPSPPRAPPTTTTTTSTTHAFPPSTSTSTITPFLHPTPPLNLPQYSHPPSQPEPPNSKSNAKGAKNRKAKTKEKKRETGLGFRPVEIWPGMYHDWDGGEEEDEEEQ
ncbi:MAG: hypothetical protein Q9227_004009 [Pyrenula ochraceoflavens]